MPLSVSRLLQNRWAKRVSEEQEVQAPQSDLLPALRPDTNLPALLPDAIDPRYVYVVDPAKPSQLAHGLIFAMQKDTGRHHRRV